jgi:hypothetical protein
MEKIKNAIFLMSKNDILNFNKNKIMTYNTSKRLPELKWFQSPWNSLVITELPLLHYNSTNTQSDGLAVNREAIT